VSFFQTKKLKFSEPYANIFTPFFSLDYANKLQLAILPSVSPKSKKVQAPRKAIKRKGSTKSKKNDSKRSKK
jgi:hypothetical protein